MDKRILSLQDFSSVGRCSLTAAIPLVSAIGNELVALPTALYSTQTAIDGFAFTDLSDSILPSYEHFKSIKINFDCLYTGFLGSMAAVDAAISIAKDFKTSGKIVAVDPAMADNGELYSVFDKEYYSKMSELVNLADVLLPNFTEGKMLAGISSVSTDEKTAVEVLRTLESKGRKTVVLSGVTKNDLCGTATLSDGKITFEYNKKFDKTVHGAGDILSSIVLSLTLNGLSYHEAAQKAVDFIHFAITETTKENKDLRFGLDVEKCLRFFFD